MRSDPAMSGVVNMAPAHCNDADGVAMPNPEEVVCAVVS
jgi:hypothetical protein